MLFLSATGWVKAAAERLKRKREEREESKFASEQSEKDKLLLTWLSARFGFVKLVLSPVDERFEQGLKFKLCGLPVASDPRKGVVAKKQQPFRPAGAQRKADKRNIRNGQV